MEKLTIINEDGSADLRSGWLEKLKGYINETAHKELAEAITLLADYEEIGETPNQVRACFCHLDTYRCMKSEGRIECWARDAK